MNPKSLIILRSNDLDFIEEAGTVLDQHFRMPNRVPKNLMTFEELETPQNEVAEVNENGADEKKPQPCREVHSYERTDPQEPVSSTTEPDESSEHQKLAIENGAGEEKPRHYDTDFLLSFKHQKFGMAAETRILMKHLKILRDQSRLFEEKKGQNDNENVVENDKRSNEDQVEDETGYQRNRQPSENAEPRPSSLPRRRREVHSYERTEPQEPVSSTTEPDGSSEHQKPAVENGVGDEKPAVENGVGDEKPAVESGIGDEEPTVEKRAGDEAGGESKAEDRSELHVSEDREDRGARRSESAGVAPEQAGRRESPAGHRKSVSEQGTESEAGASRPAKPHRRLTGGINQFGNVSFDVRDLM